MRMFATARTSARILLAVGPYLKNDYHHELDDETEWSWTWSTVGLIDQVRLDVDNCTSMPPNPSSGC